MAFAVPNQWLPSSSGSEAEFSALPTPGNWVFAMVALRVVSDVDPQIHVGDVHRNIWTLLYDDFDQASVWHDTAKIKIQVWACPAPHYDGWDKLLGQILTMAKADGTSDARTVLGITFEVSGFVGNNLTVDSVTPGTATGTSSFSVTSPAPAGGANCFHFAAAVVDDDNTTTLTATGAGFTPLLYYFAGDPDVQSNGQWKASTSGQTASWTSNTVRNWAGVIVAIRETGTAVTQPDPDKPTPKFELGFGYDMTTPLSAVRWTDQSTRLVTPGSGVPVFSGPRGIPYELGTTQSELTDLKIRNDDGALTPRDVNLEAAASAAGTTTTIKILDADATGINAGDFFRLKDSALAYKELTVFQVSGVSSSAGTTTVTFGRADGVAGGAAAATASGDVYAGIEIDLDMPWRYRLWMAGKWWPAGSGWLGQLPQTWLTPAWGEVPAVGTDALASLTAEVQSPLQGEIMRRMGPKGAYWPLSDPPGATTAQDVSGNSQPPLVKTVSKYGGGAATTADFGAGTQNVETGTTKASLLGDSGSGWYQTGLTRTELDASKGYALVAKGGDFPPIADGVTVLGVVHEGTNTADLTEVLNSNFDPTLFIIKNSDPASGLGQGAVLKVSYEGQATDFLKAKVTVWDKDTHSSTVTIPLTFQIMGSEFRMWGISFDRTSWTFYGLSSSFTGSCDLVESFDQICVAGEADQFHHGKCGPGIFSHIAIIPRKVTAEEFVTIRAAMKDGEVQIRTTAGQVANKMNIAGWQGPRIVLSSDVYMSAEGNPGGTVADYAEAAAAMDDGLAFVDASGQYQWRGHSHAYFQASRATLGEDTGAGEIPYQPGQRYGFDKTFIYNDVQLSNQRNSSFGFTQTGTYETRFVAFDAESQRKRGKRTLPVTARLNYANDAYGLAWALANRYKSPRLRVEQVVIDAATYPAAWPFVLAVEVGDLVTVKRRPMGAPAISQLCRVLRIEPVHGPSVARWTLSLIPVDPVVTLGDGLPLGDGTIGW